MEKILLILILVINLYFPTLSLAETIILKSGQKIEGKISEKTDKYINVDIEGTSQPYFFEDIESIDGEPVKMSQHTLSSNNTSKQDIVAEKKDYYLDKNSGFKIIPPKGFDEVNILEDGVVKFTGLNNPDSSFMITYLYAPYEEFQAKLENEDSREEFINSMIAEMVRISGKFIGSRKREINGIPAWEFTLESEKSSIRFIIKNIYFNKSGKQYSIMYTARDNSFDMMQNDFEESIASLEIF